MGFLKYILLIIYVVVTLVLIVLTLIQSKESRMKRLTITLGIAFAVLAILLSIFYI